MIAIAIFMLIGGILAVRSRGLREQFKEGKDIFGTYIGGYVMIIGSVIILLLFVLGVL